MTADSRQRPGQHYAALDWSRAYRVGIQMRYADLDTMGHLNNAVYVQYFETARVLLGEHLRLPEQLTRSVIARQEIDYLREVRWGQRVSVDVMVEQIGRTSWTLVCRLLADDQICAYARTVQVRVGQVEGQLRPVLLDDEVRASFAALLSAPAEQQE